MTLKDFGRLLQEFKLASEEHALKRTSETRDHQYDLYLKLMVAFRETLELSDTE